MTVIGESSSIPDKSSVLPPEGESRVVTNMGHVTGEVAVGPETEIRKVDVPPSGPAISRVEHERSKKERIDNNLGYLTGLTEMVDKSPGGWRDVLSGEDPAISMKGLPHVKVKVALKKAGVGRADMPTSVHEYVDSGVDYKKLEREHPTERFKFYHSFKNADLANEYAAEVAKLAAEAGISLSMKPEQHDYDGVDFYTFHFKELQEIIAQVYERHKDAFGETEHFLQGPVADNVDPRHVGWVQEPVVYASDHTHSGRMGVLGEVLDKLGLNEGAYKRAAAEAGVRPDMPWMLSAEYEEAMRVKAAERNSLT